MKKNTVFAILLVVFSVGLSYLAVEAGVRAWMWYKYSQGNYKMVAKWRQPDPDAGVKKDPLFVGWEKPNTVIYQWQFDEDSRVAWKMRFHMNNVGLSSWRDYIKRESAKEYRIAVVGDSFTAGLQMDTPWPDKLEDLLNADNELKKRLGCESFKVYNLGQPAGGFPEFASLAETAKKLDPDMVILNYIAADFPRCNSCGYAADNAPKQQQLKLVDGDLPIPTSQDAADDVFLHMACEREPIGFDNDTCRHSFTLTMPPQVAQKPELVRKAKQAIVDGYLRGQLWTSHYPYALSLLRGRPISLQEFRSKAVTGGVEERRLTDQEMIDQAVRVIRGIKKDYPGLIVTLNPTYEDLTVKPDEERTSKMIALDPGIEVERMRFRLPQGLGKEDVAKWYCLPFDGHMSDEGGKAYAQAMLGLIRERAKTGR